MNKPTLSIAVFMMLSIRITYSTVSKHMPSGFVVPFVRVLTFSSFFLLAFQCFDIVVWVTGRASGL